MNISVKGQRIATKKEDRSVAKYLNKKQIKQRGWSERMIAELLGQPDKLKPNPMYKSSAPMHLFFESRVIQAENSASFQDRKSKKDKRTETGINNANKQREKLLDKIEQWQPEIEKISFNHLQIEAINHYNDFHMGEGKWASRDDSAEFLHRIMVNYIRHQMTSYENALADIYGKVGVAQAYLKIKEKILRLIAEKFPALRQEAIRQLPQTPDTTS